MFKFSALFQGIPIFSAHLNLVICISFTKHKFCSKFRKTVIKNGEVQSLCLQQTTLPLTQPCHGQRSVLLGSGSMYVFLKIEPAKLLGY